MFASTRFPRRTSRPFGSGGGPSDYAIEVFYDGDCPLCRREIGFLRLVDRRHRLRLTDIAAPGFRPEQNGRPLEELMAQMHGRLPNGEWVTGVEAIRRMYSAVGLGWLASASRLPGVSRLAEAAYQIFARNRLRWTGRCNDRCRAPAAR